MTGMLKHISQSYPTQVPVLIGAAEELVTHRELRNKYETNRNIKTWSCWFLLKALTTSGQIQQWQQQMNYLLTWVQMNENTFRQRLNEMLTLNLISIEENTIHLVSFEKAAEILGVVYVGTHPINYNPIQHGKKQTFQYLLRANELKQNQEAQLGALLYKLDENPRVKNDMHQLMVKAGADDQRLYKDRGYYQQQLLNLQMMLFKTGSDIFTYACTFRADINRSVRCIQQHHHYKSAQSVSYMKGQMKKLGIIRVEKICVESKPRCRLYIPDGEGRRDGYKWIAATRKTAWFLTDQISFQYEIQPSKTAAGQGRKAA